MSLAEQPNYGWTSTITDDANTYDIEGKACLRDHWTWMRMPLVKDIARRLGRDADTHLEALFRDSATFVIRTGNDWRTLAELPKRHPEWRDEDDYWVVPVTTTGLAAMGGSGALANSDPFGTDPLGTGGVYGDRSDPFAMRSFPRLLLMPAFKPDKDAKPHSNAQFALTLPHDELAIMVSSCVDYAIDGDTVTGTLSDSGAQLLLVRDGQDHLTPLAAAGLFKFHIKHGIVSRYQLMLEGILLVDKKRVHVRQTSATTIKDVGTTTFDIPDEARRKVAGGS